MHMIVPVPLALLAAFTALSRCLALVITARKLFSKIKDKLNVPIALNNYQFETF